MATREPLPSVYSSEGNRTYKLHQLIGRGGFGEVYLATPQPRGALPSHVCVKVTDRLSPWLRESYFAELLYREPRALRVFDRFVVVDGARTRYCLVMEYAEHGDLGAWLERKGPQAERWVRREIAGILAVLDALHRGQALHRDLTPFNVFVCEREQLKLGDFGIATHQLSRRGVTADAFNLFNVPNEIAWGRVRRWQQRDDIYQVGLIAVMLLRGETASPIRSRDVRTLPCSDHLKEVIHRCLGVRGKRYEAAGELITALAVVHGFPEPAAERSDRRRETGGRHRAGETRSHDRRPRPRPDQCVTDCRRGGRREAPGDPAPGGEGTPGESDRRSSVLEARSTPQVLIPRCKTSPPAPSPAIS